MMKKICLLVLIMVLGKISYSQYPIQQFLGADSAIVTSKGGLQGRLINWTYPDTATANTQRIRQYPGAQIATINGGLNLWVRNATATAWLPLALGSGNNIYTIDGTLLGNRELDGDGYGLNFAALRRFGADGDSVYFNFPYQRYRALTQDFILSDSLATLMRSGNAAFLINSDSGVARLLLNPTGPVDEKKYELAALNEELWVAQISDNETLGDTIFFAGNNRVGIKTNNPRTGIELKDNTYVDGQFAAGDTINAAGTYAIQGATFSPYIFSRKAVDTLQSSDPRTIAVLGQTIARGPVSNRLVGGAFFTGTDSSNSQNISQLRALQGWTLHNGTGTVTNAWGSYNVITNNQTGTITNAYGSVSGVENRSTGYIPKLHGQSLEVWNLGGGAIDTVFGQTVSIYNSNPASTIGAAYGVSIGKGMITNTGGTHYWRNSGTIGTSYGLYLDSSIDVGINKYSIYSFSNSPSYFRGNLGLGTSSPDSMLTVANGALFQRGVRMSGLPAAQGTKALRIDANGTISTADTLIDAGGTVTSIATNNGSGITGGTITTTGTLSIDTTNVIATKASVAGGLAGKLNISDTASMLSPYVNNVGYGLGKTSQSVYADSSVLSAYYLRRKDSLTATNSLGYVTKTILADTAAAIRGAAVTGFVPYTGATQNVNLGEYGIASGFLRLDTTPTGTPADKGTLYWENNTSTVSLIMNGTIQRVGQSSYYYVKNETGVLIPKGTAVRFNGTDGGSGHLLIAPFLADGTYPSTYFMGITSEDIDNGGFGQVIAFGRLDGVNTNSFADGDILYASTTVAGGFQTTVPQAPNNIVQISAVINAASNGKMLVRPTLGSNINNNEGVKITSPTSNSILVYNTASGLWVDTTVAGAGIAVTQVNTNSATGITGGPITTTGTIAADTLLLSTRAWRQKGIDSVQGNLTSGLATKLNISDTASMLSPYARTNVVNAGLALKVNISDTASMLSPYLRKIDTTSMLSPYLRSNVAAATYVPQTRTITINGTSQDLSANRTFSVGTVTSVGSGYGLSGGAITGSGTLLVDSATLSNYYLRRKDSLTATNLLGYVTRKILADTASAIRSAATGGTVTSVATNTGTGITGGTIITSGTLALDTLLIATRAWRKKGDDSVAALLSGYVPTSRTITINGTSYDLSANRTWNVGTVTSVATSTGTGITGGTITGSGTIAADTLLLSTRAWRQKGVDSVAALANSKVSSVGGTSPISSSGGTSPTISISQAGASSNGFLSSTDWNTFNNKQNALTNPVTGTGTTNYIPKFTGTSAIGNSAIYDNGGNIGIGTLTSSVPLTVSGGSVTARFQSGSATDGRVEWAYNTTDVGYIATPTSNQFSIWARSGNSLLFGAGNQERMRLDASGNLGINTSSPSYKLDVNGTARTTSNLLAERVQVGTAATINDATGVGNTLQFANYSAGAFVSGSADAYIYKTSSSFSNLSAQTLIFQTRSDVTGGGFAFVGGSSPAVQLHLNSSGSLGLGVTPSAWGSGYTAFQMENTGFMADADRIWMYANGYFNGTNNLYIQNGFATRYYHANGQHIWENAPSGTAGNAISFTQAMTLFANGGLGLATTTPTVSTGYQTFSINGSTGGQIEFQTSGAGKAYIYSNSTDLRFYTNGGAYRFENTTGLEVGYSAAQGLYKLDVNGTGRFTAPNATAEGLVITGRASDGASQISINNNGGSSLAYIFTTSSESRYFANTGIYQSFWTGGSERMRITSGGELLINTTSYLGDYKLQINGNARVGTSTGSTFNITTNQAAGSIGTPFYTDLNFLGYADYVQARIRSWDESASTGYGYLTFWTNTGSGATEKMRITSGGNVLLNNASSVLSVTSNSNNLYIGGGDFSPAELWLQAGTSFMNFYVNGANRMRITSGGNVGIGTTSPTRTLTVYNTAAADAALIESTQTFSTLAFKSSTNANTVTFGIDGVGNAAIDNKLSTGAISMFTNGSERMRITSGGELLINTTSDVGDYKLQVAGNSLTRGLVIDGANNGNISQFAMTRTDQSWGIFNETNLRVYTSSSNTTSPSTKVFEITTAGNVEIPQGSIKTAAPSGGTAKPYKWGEAGVAIGGSDGYAVKVEIDGTLYYLMTGYLPEPAPEAAPSAGPAQPYSTKFEEPIMRIKTDSQKVKDLEKQVAELKEMISKLANK